MTTLADLKNGEFFVYDGEVYSKGNGTIFMFNSAFVTCHSSYGTIELPARTKVKRHENDDDWDDWND